MHTAFLSVNVKYLGHTRIVLLCARDIYCFLHIQGTLSPTLLTQLTYSLATIFGDTFHAACCAVDGYAA